VSFQQSSGSDWADVLGGTGSQWAVHWLEAEHAGIRAHKSAQFGLDTPAHHKAVHLWRLL